MMRNRTLAFAVLAIGTLASSFGQTYRPNPSSPSGAPAATQNPAIRPAVPSGQLPGAASAGTSAAGTGAPVEPADQPLPHITIATPAPAPAPWTWQQKLTWSANIVLVVLGYIAIVLVISLLRKIERQTRFTEETAKSASEAARAALIFAEAMERSERPWILVSIRPSHNIENGFTVMATNRGKGPARILSTIDDVTCVADENRLDPRPVFRGESAAPEEPIILLPGESIDLKIFNRADVADIAGTEERLKRVENWDEKIYLYGNIVYQDLAVPNDAERHESAWCAWYIHGRQKSGMVMAGPPAYNRHT
jgi:hypothetical protein